MTNYGKATFVRGSIGVRALCLKSVDSKRAKVYKYVCKYKYKSSQWRIQELLVIGVQYNKYLI